MKNYSYQIEQDCEDFNNPRQWDNLGTMVCRHKEYNLGDKHDLDLSECSSLEDVRKVIEDKAGTNAIILPLYLYDHSGVTISTKPFNWTFDRGQVGFIYAMRNSEGLTVKQITQNLEGEVEAYDQFLRGEIYSAVVKDENGEIVESCGGFWEEKDAEKWVKEAIESLEAKPVTVSKSEIRAAKETLRKMAVIFQNDYLTAEQFDSDCGIYDLDFTLRLLDLGQHIKNNN